jgi:prevent-host-death family protein
MRFMTISELRANAPKIVSEIEQTREEVIITKRGKPVVKMQIVTEKEFSLKSEIEKGKGGRNESTN